VLAEGDDAGEAREEEEDDGEAEECLSPVGSSSRFRFRLWYCSMSITMPDASDLLDVGVSPFVAAGVICRSRCGSIALPYCSSLCAWSGAIEPCDMVLTGELIGELMGDTSGRSSASPPSSASAYITGGTWVEAAPAVGGLVGD
jgi:hypothetical protein